MKGKKKAGKQESKGNAREIIPVLIILGMLAISAYLYPSMPDVMPTHWNSQGVVDGHSSKAVALFLIPLIVLAAYLVLSAIPYLSRYHSNIVGFRHFFGLKLSIVLFLFVLYVGTMLISKGYPINIIYIIIPAMAALFFYIGHTMKNIQSNYFIGIRTPWTLASEEVWAKTHKATSKLMQWCALIMLLGLLIPKYAFVFVMATVFTFVIFAFVYSFMLYKKINDKETGRKKKR